MTKLSDLLTASKAFLGALTEYDLGHITLLELLEAKGALNRAIAAAEKPYDTTADTHTATWRCLSHARCGFKVTVGGSERYVTSDAPLPDVIFGFAQHYGDDAFRLARRQTEQDRIVEPIVREPVRVEVFA